MHDVGYHREAQEQYQLIINDVLEEGACVTVEPGIYFQKIFIDKLLGDPELA